MPPALSDDEGSDTPPPIPRRAAAKKASPANVVNMDEDSEPEPPHDRRSKKTTNGVAAAADEEEEEDEDDEDGDDDEDNDEYVVEKILQHMLDDDNELRFQVKWEGYDKKEDLTWEPEAHLEGPILDEYYKNQGGKEKILEDSRMGVKTKKRGRQSVGGSQAKRSRKNGEHPLDSEAPEALKDKAFKPPAGSWEDLINIVDMYRNDEGVLTVFLTWFNGEKTQHPTKMVYSRCPQKMLAFYESKINFKHDEIKQNEEKDEVQS